MKSTINQLRTSHTLMMIAWMLSVFQSSIIMDNLSPSCLIKNSDSASLTSNLGWISIIASAMSGYIYQVAINNINSKKRITITKKINKQ